jgi:DNA-binding NarL/FixJ family response regulator
VLSADETTDTLNDALQSGVTVYIAKDHLAPQAMVEQIATAVG